MSGRRFGAQPGAFARRAILIVSVVAFLIPILALFQFTLRKGQTGQLTLEHYVSIVRPADASTYDVLWQGLGNSLVICVVTLAIILLLLLPTMLLVELRYPKMRRWLEFVCILPITVPTVVLVVGFVPVYSGVAAIFGSSPWTLAFAIGIIVLPYAYRPMAVSLAAFDIVVLTEAARSLGAGWGSVIARIVLPNLRRGIASAVFITIAVVLGEFTIASFLSQNTFQTALILLQQSDPYVAAIFALFALVLAFVLLLLIGRLGSLGRNRRIV
ncbi:ABC transporter permease subunit [Diaminobutyricibacter tongyongensis]|uniref:ABC transporter permease subunit n=1 Tax=Leifsonia tongyongensis TaxID=1268043 RepID=A0A6L9Y0P9_9MICO|nr:ABC transporter permease subunit [Diaminobutyricibacter tongyongensis]NEN07220.1 ABC transporter permease subunit [Diaminobutyricibacter tongyongensis]